MRWILLLLAGVAAILLVLVIVGMILPRSHHAASHIELKRQPAEVWAVVRDLGSVPTYWPDIKASVRRPDQAGHEAWSQTMKDGFVLPLTVEEDQPPSRMVTRIGGEGKSPFGGSWTYQIQESPGGSRISIAEDGWVNNPFFRVISRIMGYHSTIDRYLRALGTKLGETVQPVHEE